MAVRVPLQFARPEMRLARPVCDADGHLLVGAGTALDTRVCQALRRLAVQSVVVTGADGLEGWEMLPPLDQQLIALRRRLAGTTANTSLELLTAAIGRYLARRTARLAPPQPDDEPTSDGGASS
ncbi:MAG: hypothetical protein HY216_04345 [Candidatus Rokubacteria bacterium]|nr:hypothetical protein [Candidatus Rokubacteria bacterium]